MQLAGLVKQSFCDWPGRVTAVLFTQGCNFRCPWCHNPSLIPVQAAGELLDENAAGAWLSQYRELLDGVVVSGGEPTLQPGLAEFLARIKKETGLAVKLDTNGSFPEVVEELLRRGLVDVVAVDYKVPAGLYGAQVGYAFPRRVLDTVRLVTRWGRGYVRTTVVPGLHTEEILARMRREAGTQLLLQPFRPPPGNPWVLQHILEVERELEGRGEISPPSRSRPSDGECYNTIGGKEPPSP